MIATNDPFQQQSTNTPFTLLTTGGNMSRANNTNNPSRAQRSCSKGFTLIELMIVIAIVAILATIALPSYQDYITRSRVAEATSALAAKRASIEQFYDNNRTYAGAPVCSADSTTSKSFTFSCTGTPNTTQYTLEAAGTGPMSGFTYTIDQANARGTTIASPSKWTAGTYTCWVTRKDGSC